MDHVTRINLKTAAENRKALIDYCLNSSEQYIAIGWNKVLERNLDIKTYEDFYYRVKEETKSRSHALGVFWSAKKNDLFWTRDYNGFYWICRVESKAEPKLIPDLDIGAVIPVKAFQYGIEVPGQIKASFNRANGGTCETIRDIPIVEFSKKVYNDLSHTETYQINPLFGSILDNLPDFDLEELVISYIQLKYNYYVLSNSIAQKSTTVKIECEFITRDKNNPQNAVVQVKGGKSVIIDALDYCPYDQKGYIVFLYAPFIKNQDKLKNCVVITRTELMAFYTEYKSILPDSITKWENIFA